MIPVEGTIAQFRYNPEGIADGFYLSDGTEVHFPPHLSSQVTAIVAVRTSVRVSGRQHTGPAGDTHIDAEEITNLQTGTTVVVGEAPLPPRSRMWTPPPRDPQAELLRASVEMDGAYRDLRRAEIMVTQLEETYPGGVESQHARAIIDMATTLYMESQRAYQAREGFRAAEYAVAVRDLMRAVDEFYNAAINSR